MSDEQAFLDLMSRLCITVQGPEQDTRGNCYIAHIEPDINNILLSADFDFAGKARKVCYRIKGR